MKQKHLFVVDPLEKLKLKLDSSLKMAKEFCRQDHEAYMVTPDGLFRNKNDLFPKCYARKVTWENLSDLSPKLSETGEIGFEQFQGIHMRKEPPFNIEYISITWLLDQAPSHVKVYNNPSALRSINEKLSIISYPELCDKALISINPGQIYKFIEQNCNGLAIVKPLDLFSGKGLFKIDLSIESHTVCLKKLEDSIAENPSYRIVQPFQNKIYEGEVRVFTAAGEIINWCLKVPPKGDFLANTSSGATLQAFKPSKKLEENISYIAKDLYNRGVFLTGFDIIGDYVSEINITSPRLLQPDEDKFNYYQKIVNLIIKDCA